MGIRFQGLSPHRAQFQRRRMMLVGGSSIVFAMFVIGVMLVYSNSTVQAREDVVAQAAEKEDLFGTVSLLAPDNRIPKGTKLTRTHVREVHWPRDQVPAGAIRNIEDIEGMFSSDVLPSNQPILRSSVSVSPPSFGISELLPEGHRAVSIQVDAITGVEGWASAGAHVDVLVTYVDSQEGITKTRVAVEDAIVLSYGRNANRQNSSGSSDDDLEVKNLATTVTLAVPLEDSLKIQTATAIGEITLALRNSADIVSKGDKEFSANDWGNSKRSEPTADKSVPKGFIKYYDRNGNEQEFLLDNNDQWYTSTGDAN